MDILLNWCNNYSSLSIATYYLLFGGNIRENIEYGKPGASEEEIIQANLDITRNILEVAAEFGVQKGIWTLDVSG